MKKLDFLFPAEPRDFPMRRPVRVLLRTAHIFTGGVLLGGLIFNQPWLDIQPWWIAMAVSGLLLFLTDLHASFAILFQLSGVVVLLKLVLVAVAGWIPQIAIHALLFALIIGSISSHMSGRLRHLAPAFARDLVADRRRG